MAPSKKVWFRFYVEMLTDPKIRRLTPAQRWLWSAVLGAARQSPRAGWLLLTERVPMVLQDLAELAGMSLKDVEAGVARMVELGILEWDVSVPAWFVPKFGDRQYETDDSTQRSRRHRTKRVDGTADPPSMQRPNDVASTVDATFHQPSMERPNDDNGTFPHRHQRTETETETELLVTSTSDSRQLVDNPDDDEFEWSSKFGRDTLASFVAAKAGGEPKPPGWLHAVQRNAIAELADAARQLLVDHDLTATQLGQVLAGQRSILAHTRRPQEPETHA